MIDEHSDQQVSKWRRFWRWIGICLTVFVVTGAIIYREWITAGVFLSMGIGNQIDPKKSKTHYIAFIILQAAMIVLVTAYLYSKWIKNK